MKEWGLSPPENVKFAWVRTRLKSKTPPSQREASYVDGPSISGFHKSTCESVYANTSRTTPIPPQTHTHTHTLHTHQPHTHYPLQFPLVFHAVEPLFNKQRVLFLLQLICHSRCNAEGSANANVCLIFSVPLAVSVLFCLFGGPARWNTDF